MKVRDVLRRKGADVATLEATETLASAIRRFVGTKCRALVVTESGKMTGILTIRDVLAQLDARGGDALAEPASAAMTREVVSVGPDATLTEAHGLFTSRGFNHLPVVVGDELIGLVTPVDVLADHVGELDEQREMLHAYITSAVL